MYYQDFSKRLLAVIAKLQIHCTKEQWELMKQDIDAYKEEVKGKSPLEQYRIFREQFADLHDYVFHYDMKSLHVKTNQHLQFFKTITIIALVLAVVAFIITIAGAAV